MLQEDVKQFIKLLEEGAQLLMPYEANLPRQGCWSEKLRRLAAQLGTTSDQDEIRRLIEREHRVLFGGMGSLNDLWIDPENGHVVSNPRDANRKLDEFRDRLYEAWQTCKRSGL